VREGNTYYTYNKNGDLKEEGTVAASGRRTWVRRYDYDCRFF
jgi:hypothetical protein